MKRDLFHILLLGLCAVLAACTRDDAPSGGRREPVPVRVSINVGSEPMAELGAAPAAPATRAVMPMGPALENPIRTLAVFQFDSEGTMLPVNDEETGRRQYYHFRDLTSLENPTGQLSATLEDVKLQSFGSDLTRVCILANVTREGADTLLYDKKEGHQMLWNDFQISTVPISYKLPPKNEVDSIGHVGNIYMFGFYVGALQAGSDGSPEISAKAARPLSVSMARIIARLEMNIKLGEGVKIPEGKKVFFGMYNAEQSAYIFVGAPQYLPTIDDLLHHHISLFPVDRTAYLSDQPAVFYFYMAPHLVYKRENATYFALWCVDEGVTDEMLDVDMKRPREERLYRPYEILMCNDPTHTDDQPSSEGSYWLNRNSIYRVNLTLTYEPEAAANDAPATRSAGAEGEYVINLARLTDD